VPEKIIVLVPLSKEARYSEVSGKELIVLTALS
jgi:hypothetical protein